MKILVATGPAHPLYFPVVPLAWALRAAGHEVLVTVPESFESTVSGSGLAMTPVHGPLDMGEVMALDREGRPVRVPDNDADMAAGVGAGFGRLAARTVDATVELVGRWRPDLVITDSYSFAAPAIAAGIHGVPWVKHVVGPGDLPVANAVERELAPELERLGLDKLPPPALVLDNCPPSLGDPVPGAQPVRYVPFGEPGAVPGWVHEPRTRPRLLVTLGSVQPQIGGIPMLGQMIQALASLDAELVVAVADHLVGKLGTLPDKVVAAGWISLTSVLPGCDAAVHHGGPGTMMACLAQGIPQVVVPGRGKPLEAIGRLADLGAVRHLPPADLTPQSLLDSCRTLLEDTGHAKRAMEVREEIARQPSPGAVVPVLEDLVLRHRTA
ncbi:nucleotide disphospho-sugar-binding domain-containing protein [Streptomyces sp. gb14]|uniref:nucleotide disphospho-sugar-binding domain-containing protein n=1 Tax=Streptomyces sp. gb14 TaxID=1827753 RepID=UPI000BF24077|nr:nucleotide disphospho-sugar-binding domain-containing protein [Streptomyces sp. gb14]